MTHRIVRLPGVWSPHSDAWMLAEHMLDALDGAPSSVLELCTGTGAIAIAAARAGAEVTAVDISRRALLTTRLNAALNRVRVRTLRGDLFAPVAGRRFDMIVSNPPYLPGLDAALPRRGLARAYEGGASGRVLLDRICADAPRHLKPGGTLLVVHSSIIGTDETLERLSRAGLSPDVVARRHGPLGAVMRRRAPALERRGLLAPGQRTEELVVIRAHA